MKNLILLILIVLLPMMVISQNIQWKNFTCGSMARRIVPEGNFLWITGGGLNKYNVLTGENINYNHANSGISANDGRAVAIDKNGNKWIGMYEGKLVKFDGSNWTTFQTPTPDFEIQDIAVDSNNIVWIGSWNGGIQSFDGTSWTVYNTSNSGLPNNYIWCLTIDNDNNIWAGTTGALVKFDRINWTVYDGSTGLPGVAVSEIVIDESNVKWIGTQMGGLVKFNDTVFTTYGLANGYYVDAIAIDNQGNKWVGCTNGDALFKVNDTSVLTYPRTGGIMDIYIDQNNNKWIGTLTESIYKFNPPIWNKVTIGNSSIPEDRMWSVFIDSHGNKWVGTESKGAAKFNCLQFIHYPLTDSILYPDRGGPGVLDIAEDSSGNIWLATERGINKISNENITLFNTFNSPLPNDIVNAVVIDNQNNKWFGTMYGLAFLEGDKWEVFNTYNSGMPCNEVTCLAIDSLNRIWMGFKYNGEIVVKDGSNWEIYTPGPNGPGSQASKDLFFDSNNDLWVAGGLCQITSRFDGTNWYHYSNVFQCNGITQESSGKLWFAGYYMGLISFDGVQWTSFNSGNSPLGSNMTTAITIDEIGNKWIGSYGGGLTEFNEFGVIDSNLAVTNTIIYPGDNYCYNAFNTVVLGGNNNLFVVENEGSVSIVSGNKISIMNGAKINTGGYFHGYITTNENFCGTMLAPFIASDQYENVTSLQEKDKKLLITAFPNPTEDFVDVVILEKIMDGNITVYNIFGDILFQKHLIEEYRCRFSLLNEPSGVYLVILQAGEKREMVKIVKK